MSAISRARGRKLFLHAMKKQSAIGINPKYRNAQSLTNPMRLPEDRWNIAARKWDKDNPVEV